MRPISFLAATVFSLSLSVEAKPIEGKEAEQASSDAAARVLEKLAAEMPEHREVFRDIGRIWRDTLTRRSVTDFRLESMFSRDKKGSVAGSTVRVGLPKMDVSEHLHHDQPCHDEAQRKRNRLANRLAHALQRKRPDQQITVRHNRRMTKGMLSLKHFTIVPGRDMGRFMGVDVQFTPKRVKIVTDRPLGNFERTGTIRLRRPSSSKPSTTSAREVTAGRGR